MEVKSKTIYKIDYINSKIEKKDIPEDFNKYINNLIDFVENNKSVRHYKVRSDKTQVINNINKIIKYSIKSNLNEEIIYSCNEEIANRLLLKEIDVQKNIEKMNTSVKKGSLVQVLIKNETNYLYLISKIDYDNFIDDTDFIEKQGFSSEIKRDVSKTCLIEYTISEENNIKLDEIKVYLNGNAKYWTNDFLEIDEMMDDEHNTKTMFKEVEKILIKSLKKNYPKDFIILRNSLIGVFRNNEHIDYNKHIIDGLINNYIPNDNSLNTDGIKNKLIELRDNKIFDAQFKSVPSILNVRIKNKYTVTHGIEINILSHISDIENTIYAIEEPNGCRYIKIKTTNDELYDSFKLN